MKLILALVVFSCSIFEICAHSLEESFLYVKEAMELVYTSPEYDDYINGGSTQEEWSAEVQFPTMNEIFRFEVPSNAPGYKWTETEKKQAFDQFLISLTTTNALTANSEYGRTGYNALLCCRDKGYTNVLSIAELIMQGTEALEYRTMALNLIVGIGTPSFLKNDIIISTITNKNGLSSCEVGIALGDYLDALRNKDIVAHDVVTNMVANLSTTYNKLENLVSVDRFFAWSVPEYEYSSNRLQLCHMALKIKKCTRIENEYFISATNQLLNATQPLVQLSLP